MSQITYQASRCNFVVDGERAERVDAPDGQYVEYAAHVFEMLEVRSKALALIMEKHRHFDSLCRDHYVEDVVRLKATAVRAALLALSADLGEAIEIPCDAPGDES